MQKDKTFKEKKFWPANSYLRASLLVLAFSIFSCMGLWIFAHFGGEWASSLSIPIPPDSTILDVDYDYDYLYVVKTTVYTNTATPEELRDWFLRAGMPMTPAPLNMENTSFIDYEAYYGFTPAASVLSPIHEYHYLASTITHGWYDEMMPTCQNIQIYKEASRAVTDYPDLDFSSGVTVFVIINCWAAN